MQRCRFVGNTALMQRLLLVVLLTAAGYRAQAQMATGIDTLYGNEWIDYNQQYLQIKIAEDGIYRVDYQMLANAGFPTGNIPAARLTLYLRGRAQPVFTTTDGFMGTQDYLEFYGEKNRGELDSFLFEHPGEEQVNPWYSMFNDTAVYYLGWVNAGQPVARFETQNNDLNNLPPAENHCLVTLKQVQFNALFKKKYSDEIAYSFFDGAGFAASTGSSETPLNFTLDGRVPGFDASLHIRYACGLDDHYQRILVNDSLLAEDEFSDFRIVDRTLPVANGLLKPVSKLQIHSPIGDRQALALAAFRYARDFNFQGISLSRFATELATNPQYVEIQKDNNAILLDLANNRRWKLQPDNGLLKVKIQPAGQPGDFILASEQVILSPTAVKMVQFTDLGAAADYLIISNKQFFTGPSNSNPVADYAAYRASAAGGNHLVKVVDVEALYDQFAYGVRYHPIAVRNFLHWLKRRSPALEHVLIIGKALDFNQFRTDAQQAALADSLFFVPNFSSPGADLPFTMRGNHVTTPVAAIGRLAVTKSSQITDYLQKVREYEQQLSIAPQTLQGKAWMKRIIHNSGGIGGETSLIRSYTGSMADEMRTNRFGADVHSFYKTSNDPVQLSAYQQLLDLVNSGVSIWTIFGHSSAFAVDFDIGLPADYNNQGKYPFMMVMGCFSGICSSPQPGIGEQFVLSPHRGAIAYVASVNYSFTDALYTYGKKYYHYLGNEDYGNSIGSALVHTINELQHAQSQALIAVLHQNLLQGDPALRVYAHEGPDYLIDNQTITFNPDPVGLDRQQLDLKFDVVNIGENTGGFLPLKAEQQTPGSLNPQLRLKDTISAPAFRQTVETTLPLSGSKQGFNRFFITLDPDNLISEAPPAAEMNNMLTDASGAPGRDLFFYANDVSPVYPPDFAIVSKQSPTLFASSLQTNAAPLHYLFELDTLETFNSALKKHYEVLQKGGLLAWKTTATLKDSTVYYWRVARDSLVNGAPLWKTHSFIYLPAAGEGWNQSHYGQFKQNTFTNLETNDTTRRIHFLDNAAFVNVQVAFRGVNKYPGFKNAYYQGFYGDYGWNQQGITRGVAIMAVDPNSGRVMPNPANGPYNYAPQQDREFFWFDTRDSLQRLKMQDFLDHQIPDGFYLGLLAFNTPSDATGYAPRQWAKDSISQGFNLFQKLESWGAKKIRQTVDYVAAPPAYGLVCRKGHPEFPAQDTIVADPNEAGAVRASFLAKWASGFFESPIIGPVKLWKSITWNHEKFDDPSDESTLGIFAVRPDQEDTLLLSMPSGTFQSSLSQISASEFPALKLRYETSDTLSRTATDLSFARVMFDPLPEGALQPAAGLVWYGDTLQQGDIFQCGMPFINVSEAAFDSVPVKFSIQNQQNNGITLVQNLPRLNPGDTTQVLFKTSTRYFEGSQRVILEVNPLDKPQEQYHFNNIYVRDFYSSKDNRNPLLDVTFDGQHILDGDLISPKPLVVATLKDENPFLAMRDSHLLDLVLRLPDGQETALDVHDPSVRFYPSDPTNLPKRNQIRLEWRPEFTRDGEYQLRINGRDATGNVSGALDWTVHFKVINRSALSNFLNYPNPFSTRTCFVYTLTGSEPPAHFRLQIMTVSGKIVREITEQEFGSLRPGTHRSEYYWDGRDNFGDQLANGVYLYRIIAKKADGSDFELFDNQSIDGYFKAGFGKMMLMR